MPELKSFSRGMKSIIFSRVINPGSDNPAAPEEEERRVTHEEPLPELDESLANLRTVVCEVMGFQKAYAADMTVCKLSLSYTKNGTRAVKLNFKKNIETIGGSPHPMDTPYFKIDPPGDGESGRLEVKPESAERVKTAIREAERYAEGERSQKLLRFEDAKAGINALADLGRDDGQEALAL